MVDLCELSGILDHNASTSTVRVRAGTTIRDLGEALWNEGLSLKNQGDIDAQTIAGALSTATHGSGLRFGSFSGTLRSAEFVSADGTLSSVGPDDPTIDAFRTSLGVLGIFTVVELEVMNAYQLRERIDYWSLGEVLERWTDETTRRRHFSFFWGPREGSLALYDLGSGGDPSLDCYVKRYDQLPSDAAQASTVGQLIGPPHVIYPMEFPDGWHELEYFVPYVSALSAIAVVREVMLNHPEQAFPLEVRTIAAESAWMSPMFETQSISISVSGVAGSDYWPYFKDVDDALRSFGGRPHWGKLHLVDAGRLSVVYPRYADFVALRRTMDPDGVFLNEHLEALFG